MALRDLIRKRSTATEARAIQAIEASEVGQQIPKLAPIAPIALANPSKPNPATAANDGRQPDIVALRPFRFDLVEADIADGCPAADLDRVNNLTWHFMEADGMEFAEALRVAAGIVAHCDPAPCEQAYLDVRTLWHRISGAG